jgi:glycosyltransferase involved in cell wall biosynthesis
MIKTVVILGAAYPFRSGGITTFNERLARAFQQQGYEVTIYNFSLQYPSFLFPGKSQYSTQPAPADLKILSKVNSINPLNWLMVGNELKKRKPDLVVVRFWLPFMGPSLGTILRGIRKNHHTKIIAITDNVIPHEKRTGDKWFTQYFLKPCDGYITMSDKVLRDLRQFEPEKPAIKVLHPLYDTFGEAVPKPEARKKISALTGAQIKDDETILLFFGFIRRYKGLDMLLEAMKILKERKPELKNVRLLIAGEYYEDEKIYQDIINRFNISELLILKTDYIPETEVKYYFCAADVIIQPYRNATQSGVTPLAYHFEKPMMVTRVGALADYVPHGKVGLVMEPDPQHIADAIVEFLQSGEAHFAAGIREEKKKYLWTNLVRAITEMAEGV